MKYYEAQTMDNISSMIIEMEDGTRVEDIGERCVDSNTGMTTVTLFRDDGKIFRFALCEAAGLNVLEIRDYHGKTITPESTCNFYEVDSEAMAENDKEWNAMPDYMKQQTEEFAAAIAENEQPTPMDSLPCNLFCKHYREGSGFPGETICCCMHPENSQMLHGYSVFDGVTDQVARMRILDAIC